MSSIDLAAHDGVRRAHLGPPQALSRSAARRVLRGLVTAVDIGIVLLAFGVAYWARFVLPSDEGPGVDEGHFVRFALIVACAVVFLLRVNRVEPGRPRSWAALTQAAASALSTALVVALSLSYFMGEPALSRVWIATSWLVAIVGLIAWRSVVPHLYVAIRDAIGHAPRIAIVGTGDLARDVARAVAQSGELVGFVDNGVDGEAALEQPLIGSIAELAGIVHSYGIDELVIALPPSRRDQVSLIIARGFRRNIRVKFLPDVLDEPPPTLGWSDLIPQRFELGRVGARPYIAFAPAADVTWAKRLSDLVLGTTIAVLLAPFFALVALAIRLDSAGPVFYRQERVGLHGRRFQMLKFRSMSVDADARLAELRARNEAVGPMFKIREDPRVTNVGRFLRRYSLDEMPQLLNVLRGEMSLVGPRPPLPAELPEYEDWQLGRLRALPGMTGLWQVGGRSEVPFSDMVRLDLHYIRNWSIALDLEIILRTIPAVVARRGAY